MNIPTEVMTAIVSAAALSGASIFLRAARVDVTEIFKWAVLGWIAWINRPVRSQKDHKADSASQLREPGGSSDSFHESSPRTRDP